MLKKVYCFNYRRDELSKRCFKKRESVVFKDENFIIAKVEQPKAINVHHIFDDITTTNLYWRSSDLPNYIKGKILKEII